MFEIPDYTGCDPDYIKSSLAFFNYHVNRTMSGKEQTAAMKTVRAKAAEYKITLEQEDFTNG